MLTTISLCLPFGIVKMCPLSFRWVIIVGVICAGIRLRQPLPCPVPGVNTKLPRHPRFIWSHCLIIVSCRHMIEMSADLTKLYPLFSNNLSLAC